VLLLRNKNQQQEESAPKFGHAMEHTCIAVVILHDTRTLQELNQLIEIELLTSSFVENFVS